MLLRLLGLLSAALVFAAGPAFAQCAANIKGTTTINSTAFPLSGNVLFANCGIRLSLRCYNPTGNAAATITYPSGFAFVLAAGGSVWETGANVPRGAILATGTAAQTLACEQSH